MSNGCFRKIIIVNNLNSLLFFLFKAKAANLGICFFSNGADPNIDSALHWSLQKMTYNQQTIHSSWKTMIMQIIERTACCNMHKKDVPCIVLAIKLGDVDIVKALIERGANIHETDGDKSSCLLTACDLGEY